MSRFDIRNRNAIKTVSSSQTEILLWIMHLYNGDKPFDCDLTASVLKFYKSVPVPESLYDKYPQLPQVKDLVEADALPDASFSSIVFDLPFIVSRGAMSMMKVTILKALRNSFKPTMKCSNAHTGYFGTMGYWSLRQWM